MNTTTNTGAASLSDEQKKQIAAVVHRDCALLPGENFYTAAELAIAATLAQISRATPTPQADAAPSAFQSLKDALHADSDYAWAWHCNLAMPIMDSIHCTPEQANKASADLMKYLFDIDVRKFAEWHHAAPLPREAATENEALRLLRGWYEANAKGTVMVEDAAYRLVTETAALLAAAANGEQ